MKAKRKIDSSITLFIILFLISVIMILSNDRFKTTKEGTLTVISLIQTGFDSVIKFSKSTLNSVGELRDLKAKYDIIKEEVDEYRGIEREVLELKRENVELKNLLDLNQRLDHDSISCEVIAKDPSNLSGAFIINKGARYGIKKNMPVVSEQNGLIGVVGKIISVSVNSSQVMPLQDERSHIASRFTDTRYEGLISGVEDEEYLELNYVKKIAYDDISIGDLVETSGIDKNSLFPKGYFIGRVSSVKKVDYDTSLKIKIDPIIDFSRVEYLSVLILEEPDYE